MPVRTKYDKLLQRKHSIRKRKDISKRPKYKKRDGRSSISQYPYKASTPPKLLYTIHEDGSDESSIGSNGSKPSRKSIYSVNSVKVQERDSPTRFLVESRVPKQPTHHVKTRVEPRIPERTTSHSNKTKKLSSSMMESLRKTAKNLSSLFSSVKNT